jgi:GrpB-like predicted nucleotidyltransferase (UPF0157 family)
MSSPLGLARGIVAIHPYNDEWPRLFEEERAAIAAALGDGALAIEHIGSTSVPGLAAKPIIDIAIAATSFEDSIVFIEPLAALGYEHKGEFGIPRRRYFRKGDPRTHQIHVFEIGGDEWRRHLHFRDHLRSNPASARAYETLKRELAIAHANDREAYTDAKSDFVRAVLALPPP